MCFQATIPVNNETISNGDYLCIVKLTQNKVGELMIVK